MTILLEMVGYLGTALVLLSMMMTSVTRLRWLNLAGSVFSMIYAFACATWPVFVLNLCLAIINSVQLARLSGNKEEMA
jgi:hypothetical protein